MAKEDFRLDATHAEDLSDGRVVAPGETFKAEPDDERIKQLVEAGAATKLEPKRQSRKTGGNS